MNEDNVDGRSNDELVAFAIS
jgi:hypothetical protein